MPNLASATASEQRTEHFIGVLLKFVDAGAKLLDDAAEASREPGAAPSSDPASVFQRVTKAVCQAIQLADKLSMPKPAPKPTAAEQAAAIRHVGRTKILRAIGNAIQRECHDEQLIMSMHWELAERLDMPGTQRDIETRPIQEVIQDIERDLGLDVIANAHPWARRYPYHVQSLYDLANEPSHPTGWPEERRPEPFFTFRPFWMKPSAPPRDEAADPPAQPEPQTLPL